MKYVCDVCGWEYDEEVGYPEGDIEPGTKWEDVPEDFVCPLCMVGKDQFSEAQVPSRYFPGKKQGMGGAAFHALLFLSIYGNISYMFWLVYCLYCHISCMCLLQ